MRRFFRPKGLTNLAALTAILIATIALADHGARNEGVQKRMATMDAARGAVQTLGDMVGGRMMFDRARAETARKNLIRATKAIPARFRQPHSDPLSAARPLIWLQWKDFRSKAKNAQRAARALKANRLESLRKTLPRVIQACLECHRVYRARPK